MTDTLPDDMREACDKLGGEAQDIAFSHGMRLELRTSTFDDLSLHHRPRVEGYSGKRITLGDRHLFAQRSL